LTTTRGARCSRGITRRVGAVVSKASIGLAVRFWVCVRADVAKLAVKTPGIRSDLGSRYGQNDTLIDTGSPTGSHCGVGCYEVRVLFARKAWLAPPPDRGATPTNRFEILESWGFSRGTREHRR
jgi:hypothetical protein